MESPQSLLQQDKNKNTPLSGDSHSFLCRYKDRDRHVIDKENTLHIRLMKKKAIIWALIQIVIITVSVVLSLKISAELKSDSPVVGTLIFLIISLSLSLVNYGALSFVFSAEEELFHISKSRSSPPV